MTAGFTVALVAAAGGVAIALQSLFAGLIARQMGIWASVFLVHLGGLMLGALLLLAWGQGMAGWQRVPWYAFLAGFVGVVIVGAVSYAVPRLGLGNTLVITIASQLIVGALLDHFGLLGAVQRPLGPGRAVGMAVLILGAWLVTR
jgi:transporter family-2 protein